MSINSFISALIAARASTRRSSKAWTVSAIGISTPWRRASSRITGAVVIPSATDVIRPTMSSIVAPSASSRPTWWLRLRGLAHVAMRSPLPARPRNVSGAPPIAMPRRASSATPRVTSAAIVMVFVFAIFATLSMMFFKQFGVGLSVAILLDATIVRAVLLPATMKLLGDWNWYLPRWLEWLPRLEHERGAAEPVAEPEPVRAAA